MSQRAEYITALEKGLTLIEAFSIKHSSLTISEAAELTGQSRASARRYLLTLEALGYVRQEKNQFYLTAKILRFSNAYIESNAIARDAQHILDDLRAQLDESTSIGVLDGNAVIFVARSTTKRILSIEIGVGTKIPAYCSSMGRVLLAYQELPVIKELLMTSKLVSNTKFTLYTVPAILKEIGKARELGYAISNEEIEIGLRSLAVPIFNKRAECVAALSISSQIGRMSADDMVKKFMPAMKLASKKITELLHI